MRDACIYHWQLMLFVLLSCTTAFGQDVEFPDFSDVEKNGIWDSTMTYFETGELKMVSYSNQSKDVLYERSFSRDGIMYSLAKYSIDSSTGRKIRKREWEKRYDEHGRLYSLKTHTDTSGTDTYYFSNGCIERQVLLRHLKGFEATNCDEFIGDEFKMDSLIHSYKTNSDRFLKDTTYSYYNIHPSGVWKSYFSNCALEFMGEYADYYVMCSMTDEFGYSYAIVLVETGHWVYFDPDGKKYKEEIWDYGKLVECIDF